MDETRRDFCRLSVVGVAGLGLTGCAGAPKGSATLDGDVAVVDLAANAPLAAAGGAVSVDAGERQLIVVNRGDGSYLAADRRCTHMGCQIDWDADATQYACPCHGSRFESDGSVARGPAKKPIASYAVESDGSTLRIALG